jgi:hypothetical protein
MNAPEGPNVGNHEWEASFHCPGGAKRLLSYNNIEASKQKTVFIISINYLIFMDDKIFGLSIFLLFPFVIGCDCKEDIYGEELNLSIPILIKAEHDTIELGDTVWIEMEFSKDVELDNSNKSIRLDSFNFFSELFINEISGNEENYYVSIDSVVITGVMNYLPLPTALSRPIQYEENDLLYSFKASIIIKQRGLFWIGMASSRTIFDSYEHPALYMCDRNKRDIVNIQYHNPYTNIDNFENQFLKTNVAHLRNSTDYLEFESVGSIVVVIE